MTDHTCGLSGSLEYAVFVDINESRNPNHYKILRRSSSFQFYYKRRSNATNSSIHSINEVELENEEGFQKPPLISTSLISTRNTFPNRHRFHRTNDASISCSIPCRTKRQEDDYCELINFSSSVPNFQYRRIKI